ncbi:hypothetical protein CMO92_02825, partial [Candidatus Woesearchaeota archaeon]|nr:hypothetical protein [Candidatus Woesearchaeota archaeon]
MKISVIGCGPAGATAAQYLARAGHRVTLFEEHSRAGEPVQCTGVLTGEFRDLVEEHPDFITNIIRKVRVHFPGGRSILIRLKRPEIIVNRRLLDEYLAELALQEGVELRVGCKVVDVGKGGKDILVRSQGKEERIEQDVLIGADGAGSIVAKRSGLWQGREFLHGVQARVEMDIEADCYHVYLGFCSEFFAWAVPEEEGIARVGLATRKKGYQEFERFCKVLKVKKVMEQQGGPIPVYKSGMRRCRGRVFLVGDAACQIKNTTGGGIIPSLVCGRALARAVDEGRSYENEWRRSIGTDLWLHYVLNRMLDRFSRKDFVLLGMMLDSSGVRKVLRKESRERPLWLLVKLVLRKP